MLKKLVPNMQRVIMNTVCKLCSCKVFVNTIVLNELSKNSTEVVMAKLTLMTAVLIPVVSSDNQMNVAVFAVLATKANM